MLNDWTRESIGHLHLRKLGINEEEKGLEDVEMQYMAEKWARRLKSLNLCKRG